MVESNGKQHESPESPYNFMFFVNDVYTVLSDFEGGVTTQGDLITLDFSMRGLGSKIEVYIQSGQPDKIHYVLDWDDPLPMCVYFGLRGVAASHDVEIIEVSPNDD